ncbi:MAG: Fic family protein [Chloroflexota bacterium]|nr:Fic family protein [Chloroflexota bacterium]MDQ3690060.1 Fic family protein [Chloroflexota bacterium]
MSEFVERRWEGDPGAYGPRRARAPFTYRAFVPDEIATLDPAIPFETHDLIMAAEAAVSALNADSGAIGLEAVGPLLLRSEAIASSRIEGYELSQRNLARALIDPRAARGTARTVAANVVAMEEAIALGDSERPLTMDDLAAIHRTLMADEPRARPGEIRREQNWIGGRFDSPIDARYIPPPETEVERLMEDLIAFLARDDLPAPAQAAIAHAQFETIHPFLDGNGRVGRCLIHVVLRRRRVAPRFVPPVSIVLAARPNSYVDGLVGFREGRVAAWCASFAGALERAARLSVELAKDVASLQEQWHERAGRPRRDSAAARIIPVLPAQPITSAAIVRGAINARHQRALEGLKVLEAAGVVRRISEKTWDQQYAADDLFSLLERYEEAISSGIG